MGLYVKSSGSWIYSDYNINPSNDFIFFKAYSSTTISYDSRTRVLSTSGSIVINTKTNRIKGRQSLVIPAFSITLPSGSYSVAYIDLNAITGQVGDVPFLCSQASTYTGVGTHGVLAPYLASQTGNTHYVAAPYYPYEFAPDNLHLGKSAGYVGEKMAHAACRISGLFGTKEKGALQPTSVSYDGANEIVVTFNVPVSPMVRDTAYANVNNPAPADWGFRIRDGAGSTVAITNIQIVGDAVKITTGSVIASGSYRSVDYALSGFGNTKVYGEQARGQLRDSEQLESIIDGQPLYNWCVHFRELF